MAAIRPRDTLPELAVRKLLHGIGYRYLVGRRVAGVRPDLVFPRRRKVIFIHGCFWHSHQSCRPHATPKTRTPIGVPSSTATRLGMGAPSMRWRRQSGMS
jgi:DNA mismatch endonuclease (patch repair protein)